LLVILYADDTVILSESKDGLQKALDIVESYCEICKLQGNVNKTKGNNPTDRHYASSLAKGYDPLYSSSTLALLVGFSQFPRTATC
jgi:hypothetical protein